MKKHHLKRTSFNSPIYAQLGGYHYSDNMPLMTSSTYNGELNTPKPKSAQVATRIRLSEGKPKKFFK